MEFFVKWLFAFLRNVDLNQLRDDSENLYWDYLAQKNIDVSYRIEDHQN